LNSRLRLVSRETVSVNVTQVFMAVGYFAGLKSRLPAKRKRIPRHLPQEDAAGLGMTIALNIRGVKTPRSPCGPQRSVGYGTT
jgi:hypothetical protein